jgi:hypothetical protein
LREGPPSPKRYLIHIRTNPQLMLGLFARRPKGSLRVRSTTTRNTLEKLALGTEAPLTPVASSR